MEGDTDKETSERSRR